MFAFLDGSGRITDSFTYSEFERQTARLAHYLAEDSGLKHGGRVLLAYPPGLEMIVAFFACARLGVIPVPVYAPSQQAVKSASKVLEGLNGANDDQNAGIAIVRRALQAPIRQIAENAGVEGSIVVGKILENTSPTFGFNAQTEEYVDLVQAGVIDPAKVVRTALQDAASVAGLLITTEAAVAEAPKKPEAGANAAMGA